MSDAKPGSAKWIEEVIEFETTTRDKRISALEAELAPWREMARQLEALRAKGWRVKLNWHQDGVWACFIEQVNGIIVTDRLVTQGATLPAAVAAAYERVVGDE